MKRIRICLVAVFLLSAGTLFSGGQSGGGIAGGNIAGTIKLASLVPETSPWGAALNKMAGNIKAETNGAVDIIVYHNGIAGGEADVLRKLRLNQIQAAILTSFGLNEITPKILALSCPFLIRSEAELDYVLLRLKPVLEESINRNGFQTIAWSKVGFVNFFAKSPARTPDQMKKLKLGTSDTETSLLNVFKSMGYQLVPQSMDQVLIDLNTGRVDAVYQEPLSAASFQLFTTAKYMMNFTLAPVMGGIVMNQAAWRRLPEDYRAVIVKHAKVAEVEIEEQLATLKKNALDMMLKNGLVIYDLTPEEQRVWIEDTEISVPRLVGTMFDADVYRQISDILKEYRQK
ncbi:MAG: TRAP transporter substrate-binding protein DctP [Spirochaetaceae bacterium]|jgi:TRAP-type C4-dicarboxylate transport system substrate-binding protein|nr:TRAP transporter substrate-binding protein DctP [Spirochaetaceae bacterium]